MLLCLHDLYGNESLSAALERRRIRRTLLVAVLVWIVVEGGSECTPSGIYIPSWVGKYIT
jgi:hypothetical protein